MKIDKNSWHYKVFVFNSQMVATMREYSEPHLHPHNGKLYGLCPYMRMILLWGPIVFIMNIIPMLAVLGVLFVLPVIVLGGISALYTGLSIIALVSGIWSVIIAIRHAIAYLDDRKYVRREAADKQADAGIEPPVTFRTMLTGYLKSAKTKVCPVLEFDDE